jgi:hypothetical protein
MVEWVENGLAPSEIIATKWVNDNVSHGEAFSRKLCSVGRVALCRPVMEPFQHIGCSGWTLLSLFPLWTALTTAVPSHGIL